jgi:beta-lactamase class A
MQTTAEDMGTLLAMLYYCAEDNTEALRLLYREELTQTECQAILDTMSTNRIGSLIEGGVPADIRVAHRHGWINDTHGDAGIVYTPGGDYVIVMMAYKPNWLEWELSSPLLADISQATYNYFNFENPFVSGARAN